MLVTINNLTESVLNPNGRFNALSGLYARTDKEGMPVMKIADNLIVFEVTFNGKEFWLWCPLRGDMMAVDTMSDNPYITTATVFPHEMLVRNSVGKISQIDVVLQNRPVGVRIGSFMDIEAGALEQAQVASIFNALSRLCTWAARDFHPLQSIKITDTYISLTDDGSYKLELANHLQRGESTTAGIGSELLSVLLVFYIFHSDIMFYKEFSAKYSFQYENIQAYLGALRNMGETSTQPLFSLLPYAVSSQSIPADTEFIAENIDKLGSIITVNPNAFGHLPVVQLDSKGNRPDYTLYQRVGSVNDGLICVKRDNKWNYLTQDGDKAFEGTFISASDFAHGRAVVETEKGVGLIDRTGNYILKPIYGDVCWDADDSLARVLMGSHFALFDSEGNQLTGFDYDTLEEPSCGLLLAQQEGMYGYLTPEGSTALNFIFDEAFSFQNAQALVCQESETFYIDLKGSRI